MMRTVTIKAGETLHIETPNGIVNVRAGLSDRIGRAVDSIETIPNCYVGEPAVRRRGPGNVRLVRLATVTA